MSTFSNLVYQGTVTSTQDDTFTPQPNEPGGTNNWAFQRWSAGTQLIAGSSSKVELFWDATGDGNNMTLVDAIYSASETYQHPLDPSVFYTVDGTARVLVRRTVLSGNASREIYAQVQGFIA
jgi:hypothetical protein